MDYNLDFYLGLTGEREDGLNDQSLKMLLSIITVNLVIFILTRQTTLIHPKTNAARITLTSRALENLSKKLEYHMRNNIKSLTDEIDKINGNY